jgi:trk system potassium uptake protein TrkA
MVAVREIEQLLDEAPLRRISTLAEGIVDVYWVRAGRKSKFVNRPLREVKLTPDWMIAAIQHGQDVSVPGADDSIQLGDTVLVIGRSGAESKLKKIFAAG